jgi:hypothetical protein
MVFEPGRSMLLGAADGFLLAALSEVLRDIGQHDQGGAQSNQKYQWCLGIEHFRQKDAEQNTHNGPYDENVSSVHRHLQGIVDHWNGESYISSFLGSIDEGAKQ